MSYHTHNLRTGDVFSAPADLRAYADLSYIDLGMPTHCFEVLDVEHASLRDGRYPDVRGRLDKQGWYMHLVARCLKCGEVVNQVVEQDISLCMLGYGTEDGEPGWLEDYDSPANLIEKWRCEP